MSVDRNRLADVARQSADCLFDAIGGPDRSQSTLGSKVMASVASYLACISEEVKTNDAQLAAVLIDSLNGLVSNIENDLKQVEGG